MANNNKLIIGVVAVAVLGGGIIALRSLSDSGDGARDKGSEAAEARSADPDSESAAGSSRDTEISTANNSSERQTDAASPRDFKRGEGAAALNPTPIPADSASTATAVAEAGSTPADAGTTGSDLSKEVQTQIADIENMFKAEQDPEARVELADELGMIDSAESVRKILDLLKQEQDPSVREALLDALNGMEAVEEMGPEVVAAISAAYNSGTDEVKISAQDVLGDIGTADAVGILRNAHADTAADPRVRLNAGENLLRARATDPSLINDSEMAALTQEMKTAFQGEGDVAYRSQALMALAINGRDNLEFFQQAATTEQDPQVKNLLDRLVRIYTTLQQHQQQGGPPPQPTPAPQQ